MKPHRVRFEVAPIRGVLGWSFTRDGEQERVFLFKYMAVKFAQGVAGLEWELSGTRSELVIKGRDGQIKDSRTFGHDPVEIKG